MVKVTMSKVELKAFKKFKASIKSAKQETQKGKSVKTEVVWKSIPSKAKVEEIFMAKNKSYRNNKKWVAFRKENEMGLQNWLTFKTIDKTTIAGKRDWVENNGNIKAQWCPFKYDGNNLVSVASNPAEMSKMKKALKIK